MPELKPHPASDLLPPMSAGPRTGAPYLDHHRQGPERSWVILGDSGGIHGAAYT